MAHRASPPRQDDRPTPAELAAALLMVAAVLALLVTAQTH
jgi:hypothetical protein